MDIATIIGMFMGLACVFIAIMVDGGQFALFFNIPAAVLVIGGTMAATCVHFSLASVLKIMAFMKKTLFYKIPIEHDVIQQLVNFAAINRKDGALALEKQLANVHDPFMSKAVRLIVDGLKPDTIHEQLSMEIANLQERHFEGKKMMEFVGAGCPAFGMVGTLCGLVQMFSNMEDPSAIGRGMAAALVCTFYGALVANLFFIPFAGKLGIRSKKETHIRQMIMEGVMGIAKGESPTSVRERMQTFLSLKHRVELKPKV